MSYMYVYNVYFVGLCLIVYFIYDQMLNDGYKKEIV